jgi:biopolymer transport protein ExbD
MNLRRRHKIAAEVNTSSINDIMFFLMLFFLIASTVVNPNVVKLLLPRSSTGKSVSKKQVSISISKDFRYYLNSKEISEASIEPEMKKLAGSSDQITIVLRVDKTVDIQHIVNILDLANKLKFKTVLATDKN